MSVPTISAYMQCFSNRAALYQSLRSFRTFYASEPVTLVSDNGDDFSPFARHFNLMYYHSSRKADPGNLGKQGALEYLRRIYDHCQAVKSDYVLLLEEDVHTRRRIRLFPETPCAGPRFNPFAQGLERYLRRRLGTAEDFGYAMCGGSIFDRSIFMECYERKNLDLDGLATLDDAARRYGDVVLTLLFLVNGYRYSVWLDVSEEHHPIEDLRIIRDSAFDHADKRWYGVDFDESLLQRTAGAENT